MSTYQAYDFVKDINFHFINRTPIDLSNKSEIFKIYLFKLKIFQLNDRIKENHPMFNETYFLYVRFGKVFLAKNLFDNNFSNIEIINGLKIIRKMKLKKLFK